MSDPTQPPEPADGQPPVTPPPPPAGDYGAPPPPPPPPPPAYGAAPPPPPAYGAAPSYATPPPPGHAAPANLGNPLGGAAGSLAEWPARAIGGLIDYFLPFAVAFFIEFWISFTLGSLLSLVALGWVIYNKYLEGQTGQSYGKKIAGTKLVSAKDGSLVGPGMAIVRWICHIVDGIPCYVGYLWPIWDANKQTFADKIMSTYVIKV
jgi:uncharacterized RDD family membrane protein YckC